MNARTRLAVDIGGTFTDLVLALPDRALPDRILTSKVLTTHDAPEAAVIAGTTAILAEAGLTGAGKQYRFTIMGPGVAPDVSVTVDTPGAYNAALDASQNQKIAAMGDKLCRPN